MAWRIGISLVVAYTSWTLTASGADTPPPTGAIVGRAVDVEGKPVAGADVWSIVWGATAYKKVGRARTDADGRFRLEPLRVDQEVHRWFDAPGMARERREGVDIFEGRDHDIGPMTVVPGTRITGRVVDRAGQADLSGAKIALEVYRRVLGPHDRLGPGQMAARRPMPRAGSRPRNLAGG